MNKVVLSLAGAAILVGLFVVLRPGDDEDDQAAPPPPPATTTTTGTTTTRTTTTRPKPLAPTRSRSSSAVAAW
jgi:hypothetical protein